MSTKWYFPRRSGTQNNHNYLGQVGQAKTFLGTQRPNKWICQTRYRIHEVFLVVLKLYWIIFRWFLAVLVTGMLGVLSVLLLALVEFVAYYSDQTDGEILKPYNGRLIFFSQIYQFWKLVIIYNLRCTM